MIVIYSKEDLIEEIQDLKNLNQSIGFVPTMGALHNGHISLVRESVHKCDLTIVSIFVNPTQFNDKKDLEKYPRTLDADLKLLENTGCKYVFYPNEKDMYPSSDLRTFDFGPLENVMEGKHRPGHFNGVAQIVSKLFDVVKPDWVFFGQKDFQQVAIIRRLIDMMNYKIQLVSCPIIREENGLAMSSRNERLNLKERENAALIFKTLTKYSNLSDSYCVEDMKALIRKEINKSPFLDVEYIELVNENTLEAVNQWTNEFNIYACIAVHCGNVRLIDNVKFNL